MNSELLVFVKLVEKDKGWGEIGTIDTLALIYELKFDFKLLCSLDLLKKVVL